MKDKIVCTLQEASEKCKKEGGVLIFRDCRYIVDDTGFIVSEISPGIGLPMNVDFFSEKCIYEPHQKSAFQEWNAKHCCTIPVGERGLNTHRREGWNAHHEAVEKLFMSSRTLDEYGNIFVSLKKHEFDKLREP